MFEIAYLTDEQLKGFKSDFRFVADFFMQMQRKNSYIGTKGKVKHMREVLQLISVLANDKRFANILDDTAKGDEPKSMSEAYDIIENKGRELERAIWAPQLEELNHRYEDISHRYEDVKNENAALLAKIAILENKEK